MENELIYPQDFITAINNISTNAFAFINVTYPEGMICTATSSDGAFLGATNNSGQELFMIPPPIEEEVTWTINCIDIDATYTNTVIINAESENKVINIEMFPVTTVLNNNSWKNISFIAQKGLGDQFWDIGDRKQIILNGKIGTLALSNYTTYVYILDFNHPINKTIQDNNIIFGGFKTALTGGKDIALCDSMYYNKSINTATKYFNMNHYNTTTYDSMNYGGWKGCDFRYDILGATSTQPSQYGTAVKTTANIGYNATENSFVSPLNNTLMTALPKDMRNVLRLWNRYIDVKGNGSWTDANCSTPTIDAGISLLTEYEVFGSQHSASQSEENHQRQMEYYVSGNSKIKYRHDYQNTAVYWWTSSPSSSYATLFIGVSYGTYVSSGTGTSHTSYGLAPVFKI